MQLQSQNYMNALMLHTDLEHSRYLQPCDCSFVQRGQIAVLGQRRLLQTCSVASALLQHHAGATLHYSIRPQAVEAA